MSKTKPSELKFDTRVILVFENKKSGRSGPGSDVDTTIPTNTSTITGLLAFPRHETQKQQVTH
jgi:hypothetical protein